MFCEKCGTKNNYDAQFCIKCGHNFEKQNKLIENNETQIQDQVPTMQLIEKTAVIQEKETKAADGKGIAAFVLSIITVIFSLLPHFIVIVYILGTISIILAIISYMTAKKTGFAKTSIIIIMVFVFLSISINIISAALSKATEDSRRDTFVDVAKIYINEVRNAVLADELKCGDKSVSNTNDGTYYFVIDSGDYKSDSSKIMESGGYSSWDSSNVKGYVQWIKSTKDTYKIEYSILLIDEESHGIENVTGTGSNKKYNSVNEHNLERNSVKIKTELNINSKIGMIPENAILCTLK